MRRSLLMTTTLLLVLASLAESQAPDSPRVAVSSELERIQADLEAIKSQLGQVLRLLNQRAVATAASGPARTNIGDAPFLGRADAPVTIVEFSDYQCPFCQRFFATTLATLKKDYIETGKLRYVFRDYPIDQLHPNARKAAEAAHCAGELGKYWEMHDELFQNSKALASSQLVEHAKNIGVDSSTFSDCLASGRHAARVARGVTDGGAVGVQGTPSFVIGRSAAEGIVEGTTVRGAQPVETFRRLIDAALAQAKTTKERSEP